MDTSTSLLIALGAGVALCCGPQWVVVRNPVTIAHELGHAFAALLAGGRPRTWRVNPDTSGLTEWSQSIDRDMFGQARSALVALFVTAAGYPAPAVVALAASTCAQNPDMRRWFLIIAGAICAVSLPWARGWRTWWATSALGAVLFSGVLFPSWSPYVIGLVIGVGGAGSVRAAIELFRARPRRGDGSDAGQLSARIPLPAQTYSLLFIIACASAFAVAVATVFA